MSALKWVYLRLACACEETCLSVWPPNASLYASSTCRYLRLLASPFGQGLSTCNSKIKGMFTMIHLHYRRQFVVNPCDSSSRCKHCAFHAETRTNSKFKAKSELKTKILKESQGICLQKG